MPDQINEAIDSMRSVADEIAGGARKSKMPIDIVISTMEDSILTMLRDVRRGNFDSSPYPLWLENKASLMSQIDQYIDTDMPAEKESSDE